MGSGTKALFGCGFLISISIHPLRGEWDKATAHFCDTETISIHPLRGEWDPKKVVIVIPLKNFNPPTPWGVGLPITFGCEKTIDFNPPTPWGVGLAPKQFHVAAFEFQSTHSVGSGTNQPFDDLFDQVISIHPLRGEWD